MSRRLMHVALLLVLGLLTQSGFVSEAWAATPQVNLPVTVIVHGPVQPEGTVNGARLAFAQERGVWKGAVAVRIPRRWSQTLAVSISRQINGENALVTFPVVVNGLEAKGVALDVGDLAYGRCEPEWGIVSLAKAGGHIVMGGVRTGGRFVQFVVGAPANAAPVRAGAPAVGLQRYVTLWRTIMACQQTPPRDPGFLLVVYRDTLHSAMDVWLTSKAPVFDNGLLVSAVGAQQQASCPTTANQTPASRTPVGRKCASLDREMERAKLALNIIGSNYAYDGVKAWATRASDDTDPEDLNDAIAYLGKARGVLTACGSASDLSLGHCGPEAEAFNGLIRQLCGKLINRQMTPLTREECRSA